MMLPRDDRAVVELAKLTEYCLDETHPRGRHKARVFAARLGLGRSDAALLRAELLWAAASSPEAVEGAVDGFGRRFTPDVGVLHGGSEPSFSSKAFSIFGARRWRSRANDLASIRSSFRRQSMTACGEVQDLSGDAES